MDDEIKDEFSLDGIVTLVDAAHIDQQLGRSDESSEQVAFADVLVLNKSDLVSDETLDQLESRLREMNRMAKIFRTERGNVPMDTVLNVSAFDLDQALERRPTFLEPEYPFEWTGVYWLSAGRHELSLQEGPDPNMSLVVVANQSTEEESLYEGAEWCVRQFAETPQPVQPSQVVPLDKHVDLQLEKEGQKSFFLEIEKPMFVGLFAQHTAEEFDIKLFANKGESLPLSVERTWVAQHEHDDEVTSIAIERDGDVNIQQLNDWLSQLLAEKGVDIFRLKGFISIADDPRRFVFQGVHMLIDSQPERLWEDAA